MPQWLAPFHLPQFTDEDFAIRKAKYIAKFGYTVEIPALTDVFKFGGFKPMSEDETEAWYDRDWGQFSEERLEDIVKEKNKKLDQLEQMLGSPTPELFTKLGSVLTALDDAQDAITTLAVVAKLARKVAPKVAFKFMSGPIGWLAFLNDVLNPMIAAGRVVAMPPMMLKRGINMITGRNMRLRKNRFKKFKAKSDWIPSIGNMIEVAQTTEQVFGIGVSLGPLMGLAQDLMHGAVRGMKGELVQMKVSPDFFPDWMKTAFSTLKSAPAALALPSDEIVIPTIELLEAQSMGLQSVYEYQERWNALNEVINVEAVEVRAPIPTNIPTINAIDEANLKFEDIIGWPLLDTEWETYAKLNEVYAPLIADHVTGFTARKKELVEGKLASAIVVDVSQYQADFITETKGWYFEDTLESKVGKIMVENNYAPALEQPAGAEKKFADIIATEEAYGRTMNWKQVQYWAKQTGYKLEDYYSPEYFS